MLYLLLDPVRLTGCWYQKPCNSTFFCRRLCWRWCRRRWWSGRGCFCERIERSDVGKDGQSLKSGDFDGHDTEHTNLGLTKGRQKFSISAGVEIQNFSFANPVFRGCRVRLTAGRLNPLTNTWPQCFNHSPTPLLVCFHHYSGFGSNKIYSNSIFIAHLKPKKKKKKKNQLHNSGFPFWSSF